MSFKEQALYLYKTAFPDDPQDFAEDFINRFFENSCRYILKDGKLVSMLFLLDATLDANGMSAPAAYLYAAATLPEYRGRGLMAELIETAKAETVDKGKYLVTKPAEPSLFGYYEKFGFKTAVFSEDRLINKQTDAEPLKTLSKEEYTFKREEFLKDKPHITLSDMDYALSFFTLLGDESMIAAVDITEAPPKVKEFIKNGNSSEAALFSAINTDSAIIRREGGEPFAMIIIPNGKQMPQNISFGLALD